MNDIKDEVSFLHDLATPLTVIRTLVRRQISEMEASEGVPNLEKQLERLKKILQATDRLEALHAERKAALSVKVAA